MSDAQRDPRPFSNSAALGSPIADNARVEMVRPRSWDRHRPGARGVVLGSIGPITSIYSKKEFYGYWVTWDDPSIDSFILGDRIREVPY